MIGNKSYFKYLFVFVLGVILLGACGSTDSATNQDKCDEIKLGGKDINDLNTVYSEYKQLEKTIDEYIKNIKDKGLKKVKINRTNEVCQSLKILTETTIGNSEKINAEGTNLKNFINQAVNGLEKEEINSVKNNIKNITTNENNFGGDDVSKISNYLQYKLFELELEIKEVIPDDKKQRFDIYQIEKNNEEVNSNSSGSNENTEKQDQNNPLFLLALIGIIVGVPIAALFFIKKSKQNSGNRNQKPMSLLPPAQDKPEPPGVTTGQLSQSFNESMNQQTPQQQNSISELEQVIREQLSQVENKIEESKNIYIQEIQSLKGEISKLEDKLVKLEQKQTLSPTTSHGESHESKPKTSDSSPTPKNSETPPSPPSNPTSSKKEERYNPGFANLSSDIEVTETKESLEKRRSGHNQAPILQQVGKNQGYYMIVNLEGNDCLVPKITFKINEYNLNTVQLLFDCHNYRDDYSKFTCTQPAKVSKWGDNWQLKEKGILEFE